VPGRLARLATASLIALSAVSLTACFGGGDDDDDDDYPAVDITIAHVNDSHSQLEAFSGTTLNIDGVDTEVDLGGYARLTTLFKQAEADHSNLLKLHAGDAVTGTLYYTFFKGAADAAMMNTICFDAFELGNHEFDDGDEQLAEFIGELQGGSCATPTPVLGANVVPAEGTPLLPDADSPLVQPYTIKTIGGVDIGIVGIDIAGKTKNSSRPLDTTEFLDEVATAQSVIDELKAMGIRHIVLLTHQGYENDELMVAQLTDVDVVIGGDSHSLLGDFTAYGIDSEGDYPTTLTNKDGDTVCIGQAWEYSKAFGLMNVSFDTKGRVASCDGQASLVIGDSFKRDDGTGTFVEVDDTTKQAILDSIAANPGVLVVEPDADAEAVLATYADQVDEARETVIGTVDEPLCLVRIPGEATNRSEGTAGCETANTVAKGSDIAQVVAEAFLAASPTSDFALQNAGGVRIPLATGDFTINDAFTVLPFSNVLVEMDLTGAEVVQALEDAVSNHLDDLQSSGSEPYAAGLRWDEDQSQPEGSRFTNVEVRDRDTGVWSAIDPAATYKVVTNDFIASGQDGYAALGVAFDEGRYVNTYLLYTQTFIDYVTAQGSLVRPARADYSHQVFIDAAGNTLP